MISNQVQVGKIETNKNGEQAIKTAKTAD